MRVLEHGDAVIYTDTHGVDHKAIATNVFGDGTARVEGILYPQGCNVAYVSSDPNRTDGYGRQLERACSVCHVTRNPAKANCWRWPEEVPA